MAITRQDEIIEKAAASDASAVPRYNLRTPDGALIGENVALELANAVTQMGTPINAAALNEMLAASGVTAGASAAYTLAQDGFALFDGAPVRFRLHTASGANATLNVNGTGAKPIVTVYNEPMKSAIPAGAWIDATYNEAQGCYVLSGVAANQYSGTVTLDATGWVSKKMTVTVPNVTETNDVFVSPAPESYKVYTAAGIVCIAQAADKLTFECAVTPTAAVAVHYKILHE